MGEEKRTRAFYSDVLGLKEIPKPNSLMINGGMWYEIAGIELHIGIEHMGLEKSKRHPAFEVEDLNRVRDYLTNSGVEIKEDIPIPGVKRFSIYDPFGNRIELLEKEG